MNQLGPEGVTHTTDQRYPRTRLEKDGGGGDVSALESVKQSRELASTSIEIAIRPVQVHASSQQQPNQVDIVSRSGNSHCLRKVTGMAPRQHFCHATHVLREDGVDQRVLRFTFLHMSALRAALPVCHHCSRW